MFKYNCEIVKNYQIIPILIIYKTIQYFIIIALAFIEAFDDSEFYKCKYSKNLLIKLGESKFHIILLLFELLLNQMSI